MAILLKNPMNASTRLSMNVKSPMISIAPPFVLRFSKDERGFFSRIDGQLLYRSNAKRIACLILSKVSVESEPSLLCKRLTGIEPMP